MKPHFTWYPSILQTNSTVCSSWLSSFCNLQFATLMHAVFHWNMKPCWGLQELSSPFLIGKFPNEQGTCSWYHSYRKDR
jgi:hypothetical protein